MLIVEETLPDGRRRELSARAMPASGPVAPTERLGRYRIAGGVIRGGSAARHAASNDDDLCTLAVAVGVLS